MYVKVDEKENSRLGLNYGRSVDGMNIHWFGKVLWERGQRDDLHWRR